MTKEKIIDLNEFADGAAAEKFNNEMQKILDNIADLNTDPEKIRTVTLTVKIKPSENRQTANVSVSAKSALAPAKEVSSTILMDRDTTGKMVGKELKSGIKGQTFINDDGELLTDTGEKVSEIEARRALNKVSYK